MMSHLKSIAALSSVIVIGIVAIGLYVASWIPVATAAEWLAMRDLLPSWAATALAIFYLPLQFAISLWYVFRAA